MKDILDKIAGAGKKALGGINSYFEKLGGSLRVFAVTALLFVVVMFFAAASVFFTVTRGAESVLVPDVTGKELEDALIEMQDRELFAKIQMRFSNNPDDKGMILEQSPEAGAVVKAGRRINLTVSRGVVIDEVEDFVGQNLGDARIRLQTLFSGAARPLISFAEPLYESDAAEAGTILRQDPPGGTPISAPVTLALVVSRGPQSERAKIPFLVGMSVNDVLQQLARTEIIFDFTSRAPEAGEKAGTVVAQDAASDETAPNYSRTGAVFAFDSGSGDTVSGLFSAQLPDYPYAVPMRLDIETPGGSVYTLLSFNHTGGNFTVPYTAPREAEIVLSVAGREISRQTAQAR